MRNVCNVSDVNKTNFIFFLSPAFEALSIVPCVALLYGWIIDAAFIVAKNEVEIEG